MTQAKQRFLSFEEYLSFDDGTDYLYELFNGELIQVPPESGFNVGIAAFLFAAFLPIVGHLRVRPSNLEIEVRGEPRNRFPDLTIIREEHIKLLQNRNTIRLAMAPPVLVIEIVSPGEIQRDRDYIAKRGQYENRGIPEYWIIDPEQQMITVLALDNAQYVEVGQFRDSDAIVSPTFLEFTLTAAEILASGG
ncbi:MAG: Uma2 family endonuclease [Leptolyngbya sp. Prado105]|nr:Uma2 family endonuclease [Leptolyngbya sp. Prado105]